MAVRSPSPSSMRPSRKYDAMLNRSGNSGEGEAGDGASRIREGYRALFALAKVRLVRHEQALDGPAVHQVLLDDLVHVSRRHVSVPDLLRVDDDRAAVLALVQAARGVGAHAPLEPALVKLLLEGLAHRLGALGGAGSLGIRGVAAVRADEDMFFVKGHRDHTVCQRPAKRGSRFSTNAW